MAPQPLFLYLKLKIKVTFRIKHAIMFVVFILN